MLWTLLWSWPQRLQLWNLFELLIPGFAPLKNRREATLQIAHVQQKKSQGKTKQNQNKKQNPQNYLEGRCEHLQMNYKKIIKYLS